MVGRVSPAAGIRACRWALGCSITVMTPATATVQQVLSRMGSSFLNGIPERGFAGKARPRTAWRVRSPNPTSARSNWPKWA